MIIWALFACAQLTDGQPTCAPPTGPFFETKTECLEYQKYILELLAENDKRTGQQTRGLWFECRYRHIEVWQNEYK